jgi:hypothetical protein
MSDGILVSEPWLFVMFQWFGVSLSLKAVTRIGYPGYLTW